MLLYIIKLHVHKVLRIAKSIDVVNAGNKVSAMNLIFKRPTFMGSRSTIIETTNNVWKEMVSCLITKCDIAIIDISQLTAHIIWEVKECLSHEIPVVLICSEEIQLPLQTLARQLSTEFDFEIPGHVPVLKFPDKDNQGLARFRQNLIKVLDQNRYSPKHQRIDKGYYIKRLLLYLFLYFSSVVFASLIVCIMIYFYTLKTENG